MRFKIFAIFLLIFGALLSASCSTQATGFDSQPGRNASADPEIGSVLAEIERDPDSPAGYVRLAAIQIRRARETGDFTLNSKAEDAIRSALKAAPADPAARKLQASLHLTFHRFREALEAGRSLEAEFPADQFVHGVLTDANVELGNYDEATKAAQKMVDLKPNSSSYARVAHLRALHGDSAGAIEMYRLAARTADPQDKEAQSWCLAQLGDEYWRTGRYELAERVYDEALANFPNYYLALGGKARVRASFGDFESAERILTELNARIPNTENVILLGDVLTRLGRPAEAERQYELAEAIETRLGVNDDQMRIAILRADHNRAVETALAITERESAVKKDIFTLDAHAWALYRAGRLTEAREAASAAMNLNTNDARILYHAGMIEKDLGNRDGAAKLLDRALKRNPAFDLIQSEIARRALAELRVGKDKRS